MRSWQVLVARALLLGALVGSGASLASPEPADPPRLSLPARVDQIADLVPAMYRLERSDAVDLAGGYPGLMQVWQRPDGRRALLLAERRPDGWLVQSWAFVLPCSRCGIDIDPARAFELHSPAPGLIEIRNRSIDRDSGWHTDARLVVGRYQGVWSLFELDQLAYRLPGGEALASHMNYRDGVSVDQAGRWAGRFEADSRDEKRFTPAPVPLDSLVLH